MNWNRLWIAAVAFVAENSYFGWHALPQSDAELIADLICMALLALAFGRGSSVPHGVRENGNG